MESYKKFIKEIFSLKVNSVELLTESIEVDNFDGVKRYHIEIYPISYLSPSRFSDIELNDLKKAKKMRVNKYWDLSHYFNKDEYHADSYELTLKEMLADAVIDVASQPDSIPTQLNIIDQWLQKFKNFADNFYNVDNMFQYCGKSPFYLNTEYFQSDLENNYLIYFNVTGIQKKESGYSPDFIRQLYDIYMAKRGMLEVLKTSLTASTGGELLRRNILTGKFDTYIYTGSSKSNLGWELKVDPFKLEYNSNNELKFYGKTIQFSFDCMPLAIELSKLREALLEPNVNAVSLMELPDKIFGNGEFNNDYPSAAFIYNIIETWVNEEAKLINKGTKNSLFDDFLNVCSLWVYKIENQENPEVSNLDKLLKAFSRPDAIYKFDGAKKINEDLTIYLNNWKDCSLQELILWERRCSSIVHSLQNSYLSNDDFPQEGMKYLEIFKNHLQEINRRIKHKGLKNSELTLSKDDEFSKGEVTRDLYLKDFINNYDAIDCEKVYNYFFNSLVEKKHLSIESFQAYLKCAFEHTTPPKQKFKLSNVSRKPKVIKIFYGYFTELACKPHGKQKDYAALLGDYFEGYSTNNVSSNFSKG